MQTVTLEFRTADVELLGVLPPRLFHRYEEVELLETLRLEAGWRWQLLRVRRRGPLRTMEELQRESARIRRMYGLASFELVERRPRTRDYILLARQRNPPALRRLLALAGSSVSPTAPFLLSPERVVASFHGEEAALRRVLRWLTRQGMPFRVLRAVRQPYRGQSAAAPLTVRQRATLARAWMLGYYAIPRRITLSRLARQTGQSPPALGKMLRRAEGSLVSRLLSTEPLDASVEAAEE